MILYMISYHIKDLTVPSPEAVAFQIEWVALCLGPSTVELTLPLNATECPKLPFAPWLGTRLFSRMAFSSPAVHSTSRLGGICSSCPKFSPIHAARSLDGEEPFVSDLSTQQCWYCVYGHGPAGCVRSVKRHWLHLHPVGEGLQPLQPPEPS
jgi:hypothetical protein